MKIQTKKVNSNSDNIPILRYLIDSDVIIDVLRGNDYIINAFRKLKKDDSSIYYSPVSKAEVFAGAFEKEKDNIEMFFNQMVCLEITETIGEKAGDYLSQYRKSHNTGLGDALLAATAWQYDLLLVTQNAKHYPMSEINILKPEALI